MPAPAACFATVEAANGWERGVSVGVSREGSCVRHQSLAVNLGAGYCCWDGGAPVAATAAATACRAAGLAAALAGLEGTTADAEKAIDPLLSHISALELRLIKECNQDFSKGSGTVTLFIALHSVVGGMAVQNAKTRNQIIGVSVLFVAGALFTLYGISFMLKLF